MSDNHVDRSYSRFGVKNKLFIAGEEVTGAWNESTNTVTGPGSLGATQDVLRWKRIGKTVFVQGLIVKDGSGTAGSGDYTFRLPFAGASGISQTGTAYCIDAGGTYYTGFCVLSTVSRELRLIVSNNTTTSLVSATAYTGSLAADEAGDYAFSLVYQTD